MLPMGDLPVNDGPDSLPNVFVHSLFRCGSTYVFQAFRRLGDAYCCFQEPFHEVLEKLDHDPTALLTLDATLAEALRHPRLELPYFHEILAVRKQLQGMFYSQFSFAEFFPDQQGDLPPAQIAYLRTLVTSSKTRPAMLQFCRSSGRAPAIARALPGVHLMLYREPYGQWWSYKVNDYFDATVGLAFGADHVPAELVALRDILQVRIPSARSISGEMGFEIVRMFSLHQRSVFAKAPDLLRMRSRKRLLTVMNHY